MFRPRALEGSHSSPSGAEGFTLSSSGAEGFTVHPSFEAVTSHVSSLGAGGFTFSSSGAEGFTFFVLGCGRVRVSHRRAPKGSRFPHAVVQAPEGSIFLPGDHKKIWCSKSAFSLRGFK